MDLLQKELQRKKEALRKAKNETARNNTNNNNHRFLRVKDIRKLEEQEQERLEQERREQQQQQQQLLKKRKLEQEELNNNDNALATKKSEKKKKKKEKKQKLEQQEQQQQIKKLQQQEETKDKQQQQQQSDDQKNETQIDESNDNNNLTIITKLRSLGLPIRLFGETLQERKIRYQEAIKNQQALLAGLSEKMEFRLGRGHGIRNPFLEKEETTTTAAAAKPSKKQKQKQQQQQQEDGEGGTASNNNNSNDIMDAAEHENDPHKRIYKYFKGLLKSWEQDLSQRSETAARSVSGRNETKTFKQCKDYIRPLFQLCKNRKLEAGLLQNIHKMVLFCQEGQFVKAHDIYMDVAIGRAAWPIGVTMVGIHARSGRAKIESSNVAHVMNSELQRKYLTSVKRLLTYAQTKRPDIDPSQKVVS